MVETKRNGGRTHRKFHRDNDPPLFLNDIHTFPTDRCYKFLPLYFLFHTNARLNSLITHLHLTYPSTIPPAPFSQPHHVTHSPGTAGKVSHPRAVQPRVILMAVLTCGTREGKAGRKKGKGGVRKEREGKG